jgi:hypothetical protein
VTAPRRVLVAAVAVAGLAVGWVMAQRYLDRHRAGLFSPKPRRRHAALGYLAGRPASPETVRMLRDYSNWERHPTLRRRAARVLRELESALGEG